MPLIVISAKAGMTTATSGALPGCHCEERSGAAIPVQFCAHGPDRDGFVATLVAMTNERSRPGNALVRCRRRKWRIAVWMVVPQIDMLVAERIQPHRSQERLRRLDQQDRPGKAAVVE